MKNRIHLATNLGRGGISILILTGDESSLRRAENSIDHIARRDYPLNETELIFGVIKDNQNERIIDEVVISRYSPECRIISGHGGSASALALLRHFVALGFEESSSFKQGIKNTSDAQALLEGLLPQTKTETQSYHCLKAINQLKYGVTTDITPVLNLLRPRIAVLAGAPNSGKSSLLNLLCGYERVLVSDIAGTTRDAVRDYIDIGGYYTHIIDTAGFRKTAGESELEAIRRGTDFLHTADTILLMLDSSRELNNDDLEAIESIKSIEDAHIITILNKSDQPRKLDLSRLKALNLSNEIEISCITESGIPELLGHISESFKD